MIPMMMTIMHSYLLIWITKCCQIKFSPFDIQAQYNAISLIPDLDLYYDVMPDDYEVVEKVGDSTTVILPYAFAKSNLTEEHWKNFKNLDFKLSLNDAENKKIEINLKK